MDCKWRTKLTEVLLGKRPRLKTTENVRKKLQSEKVES